MNWRHLLPGPHRQALCLVHAAAWLVPAPSRADWRREWIAELHYAERALRARGEKSSRILDFARGAFHDAAWHRTRGWDREEWDRAVARNSQTAGFCFLALGAILAAIAILSGLLPETRAVVLPLPYTNATRIATVTQGGATLAVRSGIHREWVKWWRSESHAVDGAATYSWSEQTVDESSTLLAKVSDDFFAIFGPQFDKFHDCRDCVVLSYDFWRKNYDRKTPATVSINGRPFRVAGVLDKQFWFLTRRIGAWQIGDDGAKPATRSGVVLRLKPDVSTRQAEAELESILQAHWVNAWTSLISISPLSGRVRSVLSSFALALMLAIGTILPAARPRFRAWEPGTLRRVLFFCGKTALALLAVLLAGLEFTRAPSITMLGGTDLATEPLSTWLFLLGCMGAISWSIYDQRRRCRVCLRRFEVAAQIGCTGCVLLSWAGTEMVCLEGHGTLHVPDMVSSWRERDEWTSLDDSLVELFSKGH